MIVYLKPAAGTPQSNLERAKIEMERVAGFRGKVTGVKVEGDSIAVKVEISPQWDLPEKQKDLALREWIRAKTKTVFKVQSIK